MDYFIKEAPFRKRVSKVINQSFRDIIYQKSKSPEPNSSPSPPPFPLRSTKTRHQTSLLDKLIQSDHKINSKKIQILKLPKLPFGKHSNYNNEDLFVSNHFIELENTEKSKELDEAMKKFRLFEKRFKKSSSSLRDTESILEKKKKYFIYKTRAGNLVANKNKQIIKQYDDVRKEFIHHKGISFDLIPELDFDTGNDKAVEARKPKKVSASSIVKRLYPSPKPHTNRVLETLVPKFSALFDVEDSISSRN